MKKIIALVLGLALMASAYACGASEPEPPDVAPSISQMKAICELAVMDCYYHNVAKFREEDAQGILWWQKDRHFWIEYSGVVKLGVDASLLSLDVKGSEITVTLPEARVLRCTIDKDSLTKDSYIVDKDSADIRAEDEVKALAVAQQQLEENAAADKGLILSAQERVQSLLTDYINNLGDAVGKTYTIKWKYTDSQGEEYPEAA